MCGEWLCLRYYTTPMVSVIEHDIKNRKSKLTSKQFQFSYWISIIPNKLKNTASAMRDDAMKVGIPGNPDSFGLLCNYQPTDYSVADAYRIYSLITTHTPQMIQHGITVAKSNNVYSIAYVEAVIRKEAAISNIKRHEVQQRIDKAAESDEILNKQKVQNTEHDVVAGQQHWQELVDGAELEKKLEELYGD